MPVEVIQVSTVLLASPREVFEAWLDSVQHSAMTGSPAQIDPAVEGQFTAWDGYITGHNIEVEPYARIVQAWRTTDFPEGAADSRLELQLEEAEGTTKLMLFHSFIPEGQGEEYERGWAEWYFEPMQRYFTERARERAGAASTTS